MRTASWYGVGQSVENCTNVESVLKEAGLDYEVEKRDLFYNIPGSTIQQKVQDKYLTVRKDTNEQFGVVTGHYEIVQNAAAFDFVNYMGDEVIFEKAGQTRGGMVYIIGRLPDVTILGDKFTPHVIFRNSFDGTTQISAAICPLRIICQNQFNFSFKNTRNTINIRHTMNVDRQIEEAKQTLKMSADYMSELNKQAEALAKTSLSEFQIRQVVRELFKDPDPNSRMYEVMKARVAEARAQFIAAYNADDNSLFKGSAWGMVNAYTDYLTHKFVSPRKNSDPDESRFLNVTFKNDTNAVIHAIARSTAIAAA